MGQSTEELSTQIAGTRESLAQDLDALQDRVSPAAIVERRKAAARDRVHAVRSRVMGSAQSARDTAGSSTSSTADGVRSAVGTAGDKVDGSPLAAGLVAFGAGLVLSALLPASEAEARAAQKVMDQGQPLVDEARSVGQDVGQNLKESATESAQALKESAQESASRVQDEGRSSAETIRTEAQDQQNQM